MTHVSHGSKIIRPSIRNNSNSGRTENPHLWDNWPRNCLVFHCGVKPPLSENDRSTTGLIYFLQNLHKRHCYQFFFKNLERPHYKGDSVQHFYVLMVTIIFYILNRAEAAHAGLPVICIPFFHDQFAQCRIMTKRLQMGVPLASEEISKLSFQKALQEVLHNAKYSENGKEVQRIMLDQPMKSRDLFLYWVNYTIRHKGAHHLIADAPFELNPLQYWSVDVVVFLVGFPLLLLLILVKLISICTSK